MTSARALVPLIVGILLVVPDASWDVSAEVQLRAGDERTVTLALLDAYLTGKYDQVEGTLNHHSNPRAIGQVLRSVGPLWVRDSASDAHDRRRLAAATFALEVARTVIERSRPDVSRPVAAQLVEFGCGLMRSSPPSPEERLWHSAALAVAERSFDAYLLTGFIDPGVGSKVASEIDRAHGDAKNQLQHARARFPDEAKFRLIAATAQETHVVSGSWGWTSRVVVPRTDEAQMMNNLSRLYLELAEEPSLRGEALLRAGVMAFRLGDHSAAVARFQAVETATPGPSTLYLSRLLLGKTHERATRIDDAETAYRQALEVLPTGQAAATALAALLIQRNRNAEVPALIRVATGSPQVALDPWRDYACGSCRDWPALIKELRRWINAG